MLKSQNRAIGVLAGAVSLGVATQARSAVSLIFTNKSSTPNSVIVSPGKTFTVSVDITATSTSDQINGDDYDITSSITGSAASQTGIEFLSRNISNGQFTSPNGFDDATLKADAMAGTLNPVLSPSLRYNGNLTDLGSSLASTSAYLSGPGTGVSAFDQADFTFEVLPNTLPGVYVLSFNDNPDVLGPSPSFSSTPVTPTSTFSVVVSVPEPATLSLAILGSAGLALRRRGR